MKTSKEHDAIAVVQPCVNSHWLSQWELFIFDPSQNLRP